MNDTQQWLSLKEAAELAGLSQEALRKAISQGRLPAYRWGNKLIKIKPADLDAMFTRVPSARDR